MKYIRFLFWCLFFFSQCTLMAQQVPASAQSTAILIKNATAHLGDGTVIENALITFENGKITTVADARKVKIDESKYKVITAEGKHVYPGFIALNSQIGLKEVDAVRATNDDREVGRFNPSIRALIAYNTDSKVTPTIRSNGVMMAQITPKGAVMPGQSSVMKLDGWNWEDAAYKTDDGQHLNWPSYFYTTGWWASPGPIKKNKHYNEQVQKIKDFFEEAKAYNEKSKVDIKNLKFEAMKGLFEGTKKLYIHTDFAKTIMEAVLFAKEFGIAVVIVGGNDAWQITDFLKENDVPLIISNVQALPVRQYDDIDQAYKHPQILEAAGITFAFSMGGAWEQRNLVFQAGQAVAYGLDYEAAIEGLTLSAAKILGIDQTTGSLSIGKDATLIIVEGDVLDMRTCIIEKAFIQGAAIDLDNKQKALSRKFTKKYGVDVKYD